MTALARLAALATQVEADPGALARALADGDALADQLDASEAAGAAATTAGEAADRTAGDAALRWRIAVMRAVIAAPPDGDAVRELYGASWSIAIATSRRGSPSCVRSATRSAGSRPREPCRARWWRAAIGEAPRAASEHAI